MAAVSSAAPVNAVVTPPAMQKANPFAGATAAAAAAAATAASAALPLHLSALNDRALAVRTPSPLGEQRPAQQQQAPAPCKPPLPPKRTRFTCCIRPAVLEDQDSVGSNESGSPYSFGSPQHKKGHFAGAFSSPKHGLRGQALTHQGSACYSDAEWFDARSEISSVLSGAVSDHAAKLEELSAMLKDMNTHPAAAASPRTTAGAPYAHGMHPTLNPAIKCPWIPEPALAFGDENMHFQPVTAHTGFAAYWLRDQERSTPYPTPIDIMMNASALACKAHASIPGIWLQETDKGFVVTVKPRFMPPGLPRYTETYDKSNTIEPCWSMRRDLRLGTTSGQIFMTTDGMLILRARSKPMWGHGHDYVMEEYMRLEDGGKIIVDRMCCMCIKSGARATQYVVGHYHSVPIKGHV